MKVIVQRVSEAACIIDKEIVSSIKNGYVLLVGFEEGDQMDQLIWTAKKISGLRIFEDEHQKMNLDIHEVKGEILSISQFTLAGDVHKGYRPSFTKALEPNQAEAYYLKFNDLLRSHDLVVKEGLFQAHMNIQLVNDGPVTIIIERRNV